MKNNNNFGEGGFLWVIFLFFLIGWGGYGNGFDFNGSSIQNEQQLCLYIKDVIEDEDSYEGMIFTRFYADCIGKGTPIYWEDFI